MSASQKVLKSAALLLSIQLIQRGLGIISTMILARLLTPEHFGIVALIVIAMQFFEMLVETGTQQYIVQKQQLTDADLNTAWSMDLLTKSVMAALIIVLSPAIAGYFSAPELILPLCASALTLPIRAGKSPGLMVLAKEINYQPMFRLTLWQKAISFLTVISVAFIYPSHWAIITGNLVSAAVLTIGSYQIHSYRPNWTLVHLKQQWSFSQWLILRGIVGFFRSQIDNLMVSKLFGTERLGGYNLVREVGLLPAVTLIIPMQQPLLAALAERREHAATLAYRTRMSLWLTISLITPITAFIMAYPELIVAVLLGLDWQDYAHLMRPFGLSFFCFCLFALLCDAMIAQGKVKLLFWLDLVSTVVIFAALLHWGSDNITNMAWARGWLAIATVVCYLLILDYQVGYGLIRLCWLSFPSLLGSVLALWAAEKVFSSASIDGNMVTLILHLLGCGTFYVIIAGITMLALTVALQRNTEEWSQMVALVSQLRKKTQHAP